MKKTLSLTLAAVATLLTCAAAKADVLADWTFETTSNLIAGNSLSIGPISADFGTGSAIGVHATSSTWSHPAGDGSFSSLSVNTNTQGDYIQFSVPLNLINNLYSGITVSYDQNGSSTGPRTYYFAYSTDGSSFTPLGSDYTLTSGITWGSGTPNLGTIESFDLSAITSLNTASTLYFRVVDDSPATGGAINGGNVGGAGTDRIDNFLVSGTIQTVPEPSTIALAGLGGFAGFFALRRKR
jgi:hypothetical protein